LGAGAWSTSKQRGKQGKESITGKSVVRRTTNHGEVTLGEWLLQGMKTRVKIIEKGREKKEKQGKGQEKKTVKVTAGRGGYTDNLSDDYGNFTGGSAGTEKNNLEIWGIRRGPMGEGRSSWPNPEL